SSGSTSGPPPLVDEHSELFLAQWTAIPSKSAMAAFLRAVVVAFVASMFCGEVGSGKTLKMSCVMFSNSMLAMETAPKLHPALVKVAHGAGAFFPSRASMMKFGSAAGVAVLTRSVQ